MFISLSVVFFGDIPGNTLALSSSTSIIYLTLYYKSEGSDVMNIIDLSEIDYYNNNNNNNKSNINNSIDHNENINNDIIQNQNTNKNNGNDREFSARLSDKSNYFKDSN